MRTRVLLVVFFAAAAAWARPAWAQTDPTERARALFEGAREAIRAGQLEAARDALAESYRLAPRPGALLNLALCEERLGRLTSASPL